MYKTGRCELALPRLEQYLEVVPDDPDIWEMKGNILINLGKYESASTAFSQAILFRPDDGDLLYRYAYSLVKSGELLAAIPLLDQVIDQNNENVKAWKLKTEIEQVLGRENEAVQSVEEALRQIPDDPGQMISKVVSLYEAGSYMEGLDLVREVIDKSPESYEALLLYADLLWMTADHNAAAAAYDRILALNDTNAKAWFLKGDSLQNAGRFEEAAIAHERAFSLGGDPSVGLMFSKKMRYLQQKKE